MNYSGPMKECSIESPADPDTFRFAPVVHKDTEFMKEYPHNYGVMRLERCIACGMELRTFTPATQ